MFLPRDPELCAFEHVLGVDVGQPGDGERAVHAAYVHLAAGVHHEAGAQFKRHNFATNEANTFAKENKLRLGLKLAIQLITFFTYLGTCFEVHSFTGICFTSSELLI